MRLHESLEYARLCSPVWVVAIVACNGAQQGVGVVDAETATAASPVDPCGAPPTCAAFGRCHAVNGVCTALSDADCKASLACAHAGQCTALDGGCWATKDSDCNKKLGGTDAVAMGGKCVVPSSGCWPGYVLQRGFCSEPAPKNASGVAMCEKTTSCAIWGFCSDFHGFCAAATDQDCREKSDLCKERGRCTASGGLCVATSDKDCAASGNCSIWGHCHARSGVCIAVGPEDCLKTGCPLHSGPPPCSPVWHPRTYMFEACFSNGSCYLKSDGGCRSR